MTSVAAGLALVSAAGAGCTATGSSTVIAGSSGSSGGNPFAAADGGDSGGGTDTRKDAGSGEPSDYDALFGPPSSTNATPDSLEGLWAGTSFTGKDMRVHFGSSSIVFAVRCSASSTIGMSVAASLSGGSIKTLESKQVGNGACGITITPTQLPSCGGTSGTCFTLSDTTLDLAGELGTTGTLTKLSDD